MLMQLSKDGKIQVKKRYRYTNFDQKKRGTLFYSAQSEVAED